MSTYIKGLDKVLFNMNIQYGEMKKKTLKGLIEAAIVIRRDMEDTPPLIPISTGGGNLRASYFSEAGYDEAGNPRVLLGFTASYAWYVHEMIGEDVNFNRPGSGPKFLEASLKRNADKVYQILLENAKGGL